MAPCGKSLKCDVCKEMIIEEDKVLFCDGFCKKHFHITCLKISLNQFRKITDVKNSIKWFCNICDVLIKEIGNACPELSEKNTNIQNIDVKSNIRQIINKVTMNSSHTGQQSSVVSGTELVTVKGEPPDSMEINIKEEIMTTDSSDTELQSSAVYDTELVTVKEEPQDSIEAIVKEEIVENLQCVLEDQISVKQEETEADFLSQGMDCQTDTDNTEEENSSFAEEQNPFVMYNDELQNKDLYTSNARNEEHMPSTSAVSGGISESSHSNVAEASSTGENSGNATHHDTENYATEGHSIFSPLWNFENNMSSAHENIKSNKCDICQKKFSKLGALKTHINVVHKRIKNFECIYCHKNFSQLGHLQTHIASIHKGIKEKCNECGKQFYDSGSLRKHVNSVHKKIRKFECNLCRRKFSQSSTLYSHFITIHQGVIKSNDNIKECQECHKIFSRSEQLETHVNAVHRGLKIQCNQCDKLFSGMANLQQHINEIHKKKKRYDCTFCHKMFSRSNHLKDHVNAVHNCLKKYECNECLKMFGQLGSLRNHLNVVHGGKRNHQCSECKKMFSKLAHLRRHKSAVHKIML